MAAEAIDVRDLGQPDNSAAAMAGFYFVNPQGASIAMDPVEAGLATSSSADFSAQPPDKPPAAHGSEDTLSDEPTHGNDDENKPRRVFVRIKRKPPKRSLSKQFQCERHGFYYTNDGRCVRPAWNKPGVRLYLRSLPGTVPPPMDR
jgi:hypothetical protein